MAYQVRLAKPAQKQLDAIPKEDYRRIYDKLKELADAPRPHGCVKLAEGIYRLRCGAYRVIFSVLDQDQAVLIIKVARRSENTYRGIP